MKRFLLLFALFALPLAALAVKPPEWFIAGKTNAYDPSAYVIGVGSGATAEEAAQNALAQLAQSVRTSVKASSQTVVESYLENDREELKRNFSSRIESASDVTVQGAETVLKNESGGVFYAMTVVSRERWLQELRSNLTSSRLKIARIRNDAESLKEQGNIFEALELLMSAEEVWTEMEPVQALYAAISGSPVPSGDAINGPALMSEIRLELNSVKLTIVSGGEQSGLRGQLLPQPLIIKASFSDPPKHIPKARLLLLDNQGQVAQRSITDDQGAAKFWVTAEGSGKRRYTITLDLARIPNLFKRDLNGLRATFFYTALEGVPLTFSVKITDSHGERVEVVERAVENSVVQAGHIIAESAPLTLSGKVEVVETHQVEGVNGTQWASSSQVDLALKMTDSGDKLGSITLKAKSVDKTSVEGAQNKSYRAFKISNKEMESLLAKAGDKLKKFNVKQSQESLKEGRKLFESGEYETALRHLTRVGADEKAVSEAQEMIEKIKEHFGVCQKALQPDVVEAAPEATMVPSSSSRTDGKLLLDEALLELEKFKEKALADLPLMTSPAPLTTSQIDPASAFFSSLKQNLPLPANLKPSDRERELTGNWRYLGAVSAESREGLLEGVGWVLKLRDDHKFEINAVPGVWSAEVGVLTLNGFTSPCLLDGDLLTLSLNLNGRLYLLVFHRD